MADKDELNQLWCGQTTGPPTKGEDMLTIAMERAERFDRTIKARSWRECGAAAVVTAIFAFKAWGSQNALACAGNLVVAASGLWIVFFMLRYGRRRQRRIGVWQISSRPCCANTSTRSCC